MFFENFTFPEKLNHILTIALIEAKYAETNEHIKKGWGDKASTIIKSESLDERVHLSIHFSPKKYNGITFHYNQILRSTRTLKDKFLILEHSEEDRQGIGSIKDLMQEFSRKDSYTEVELTAIVPISFIILHHAAFLRCYLIGTIPLTFPPKRRARASKGGKAANMGRDELITGFVNTLKSIPNIQTYESLDDLLGEKGKEIQGTLDKYEKEKSSHSLPYKAPNFDNVPSKLKEWAKDRPDLKAELDRLITPQKRLTKK